MIKNYYTRTRVNILFLYILLSDCEVLTHNTQKYIVVIRLESPSKHQMLRLIFIVNCIFVENRVQDTSTVSLRARAHAYVCDV